MEEIGMFLCLNINHCLKITLINKKKKENKSKSVASLSKPSAASSTYNFASRFFTDKKIIFLSPGKYTKY